MIVGLIPAAGRSRRMGQPKLALPVAGKTVIEHVVGTLHQAGVNPVLVVLGPHVADLAGPARSAGASVLLLPWPTPDMRATVQRGLDWLEEALHPPEDWDWLLAPGDHPTLEIEVIQQLLAQRRAHPEKEIFVPVHAGRRGHPTLIRWRLALGLSDHPAELGVNSYLREHAVVTLEVPVAQASVIEDLDTPEDYARLLSRWPSSPKSE